ncbi:hypothetical protein SO802_009167 [Lithocarpus litseifolius]|uniref:RNA polymerase sigma-70 domain-containing protein n=1 Tax=Lithocarpus litseifolius TaxID=425828 RepID=A0AAW2DAL9_9ROSI
MRIGVREALGCETISKQLAKVIGMKRRSVDKILCEGRESRQKLARSYCRLVVSIAKGYQGRGLSFQDLIQEGSIGLLRGVDCGEIEPERGHKLSTYVGWWIKKAITGTITNDTILVRLPDIIAGPGETMPEKMIKKQLMKQEVDKLLKTLDKREEHILRLRFGLNGEPPRSCEEIGGLLSCQGRGFARSMSFHYQIYEREL